MSDDIQQLLFSKKSAARMLDVSVRKLEYLLATKELESRRIGRKVLIPRHSLLKFVRQDH